MCLLEKLAIMENKEQNSLNKRTELMNRCIHQSLKTLSSEEISLSDLRGQGREMGNSSGRETKQKQRASVDTSLTTHEDGETAVAGGNSLFYLFLPGIYTG